MSIESFYSRQNLNGRESVFGLSDYLVSFRKAGFDLKGELERRGRLVDKFGGDRGGLMWISGVTDEVTEHAFEYSRKDIVRRPPAYELVSGQLFSSRFDNFASKLTNPVERGGSVVRGIKKVEERLAEARKGDYVLWSSPDGPLGVGNMEYDYSWTHVFWKDSGEKVHYVSIRTDFSLAEHTDLLNFFLPDGERISSEKYRFNRMGLIQRVLETPVVVPSGGQGLGEIGEYMSWVRKNYSNIAYRDKQTGKANTFAEMIGQLRSMGEGAESERTILKGVIEEYERKLFEAKSDEQMLRIMGSYLLAVNYLVKNGEEGKRIGERRVNVNSLVHQAHVSRTLEEIQKVAGCAGALKQNTSTFTSREIEKASFTGKCPVCGSYVEELHVGENCPGCSTQYLCAE